MSELLRTQYYNLIEGRHGRFLANPNDIYIGRSLIEYGEFSEIEWQLFRQVLRPGMTVVEAGANVGAHTVPIARLLGSDGVVHAFEPQPNVFQQLCANLALNDLLNVHATNAACGAKPGWLQIASPHPGRTANFGAFSLSKLSQNASRRIRIEALDDALDLPDLHLIKADVEGMERDVLEGAAGLIAEHRPLLYLEANCADAPPLIEYVQGLDYDMWWHLPPMFNASNHRKNSTNLFNNIKSNNVICAPTERKLQVMQARRVSGPLDHPRHWHRPKAVGHGGSQA